ncbi:VPLPA-CTERM sorting domain-containing protein [Sneathiella marina]|uniref:VPLPA-CTERM sorting domain-containing protein n=1 Tax=Sneathiella marina TaxID=2950108 RepID=A0ABY4W2Q3_9PROT|nr:VPLPA-CTERM sorting domain-containing protein [Sneathiella marina]USG61470.1 VPLPA-CTERM sorting domain-containing protein [Sneathiella marina]
MIRILAFILCMLPFGASAASVMTFTDLGYEFGGTPTYVEDGITATTSGLALGSHHNPGTAHMDDRATAFASEIVFTMAGRFDAYSFDFFPILGGAGLYKCDIGPSNCNTIEYQDVKLSGERDGIAVATTLFSSGDLPNTYELGSAFSNLDKFTISLLSAIEGEIGDKYFGCLSITCTHWDIDNVTLSAVPLPAALPLFGAGLLVLGLVRRFRG